MDSRIKYGKAAFIILALVALMVFAVINAIDEYQLISSLADRPFVICLSPQAIPILLLLPSFAVICVGIYRRTRYPDRIVNIDKNIRFFAISWVAFIVTCLVFASREKQWLR
ncbi:hypothetical protein [Halioxenophilus aromaticivorans]|uniref:hypothetical protein n=1 Tax=Halioxenophilus aromaticivorans TaxID=1306992 RepID=UPI0031E9CC89